MPTEIKIYNLISIFAGFVLCLILIKGFGKNQQEQADDTLFSPASDSMAISNDTLGSFTVYDANGNSLKARSVAGMFWEVESSKPVRIRLKDGYLESMGDSIAMGFEYGDIAKDFDDLIEKVKAKKRRGESWFVGTPLSPAAADYLMRMVEKVPDTAYVKALKNPVPKIEWRVEKEWSEVAQCSTVVKKYYETPDSNMTIYFENPDSLHKRFMFEIKSFH